MKLETTSTSPRSPVASRARVATGSELATTLSTRRSSVAFDAKSPRVTAVDLAAPYCPAAQRTQRRGDAPGQCSSSLAKRRVFFAQARE